MFNLSLVKPFLPQKDKPLNFSQLQTVYQEKTVNLKKIIVASNYFFPKSLFWLIIVGFSFQPVKQEHPERRMDMESSFLNLFGASTGLIRPFTFIVRW